MLNPFLSQYVTDSLNASDMILQILPKCTVACRGHNTKHCTRDGLKQVLHNGVCDVMTTDTHKMKSKISSCEISRINCFRVKTQSLEV